MKLWSRCQSCRLRPASVNPYSKNLSARGVKLRVNVAVLLTQSKNSAIKLEAKTCYAESWLIRDLCKTKRSKSRWSYHIIGYLRLRALSYVAKSIGLSITL